VLVLPASERTYGPLLGGLSATAPEIWAECLFVDPVSDIAVLGAPDGQILSDKCMAYEDFVSQATPLSIGRAKDGEEGWLLALDATHWFRCRVEVFSAIWISETAEPILGGMSGSPILGDDGQVIAVCVASGGTGDRDVEDDREGGPNPGLRHLPGWFLDELSEQSAESE
jgi:hypothetical protein